MKYSVCLKFTMVIQVEDADSAKDAKEQALADEETQGMNLAKAEPEVEWVERYD